MFIPNYSRVKLLANNYQDQGVPKGAIGYVIEVYDDGDYEIEFSDTDGATIAQFAVHANEVELAESEQNIVPAR